MFCTKCGTPNSDTDQFCRSCSAPLLKVRPATQPNAQQPGTSPYIQRPQQSQPPYPGYQGFSIPQINQVTQMANQNNKASTQAIAALILGIGSLVVCCLPAGIIALILGKMELNAIRDGRSAQAGKTFAKIGFYLGSVATVIAGAAYVIGFLFR